MRYVLRVVTGDGTRLNVVRYGNDDVATVVFLHGFCLDWHSLLPQIAAVRASFGNSVRIVAYDHRGHGASGHAPSSTYTVDRLAEDLGDVLHATESGGPLVLVGHSMGGMVALRYAVTHPNSVTGLVLCATSGGKLPSCGPARLLNVPGVNQLTVVADHLPYRSLVRHNRQEPHLEPKSSATLMATVYHALRDASPRSVAGFLPALRRFDLTSELGTIVADTTVIAGEADILTPTCHSETLARGIQGARYVAIPGAGHMVTQTCHRAVSSEIVDSVQRVCARRDYTFRVRARTFTYRGRHEHAGGAGPSTDWRTA